MPVIITRRELEKLAKIQCTREEMAAYFSCCINTIESRVREFYDMPFGDFSEMYRGVGRVGLRRSMWRTAYKGSTKMQIFLAKQHLGMTEKVTQINRNLNTTTITEPKTVEEANADYMDAIRKMHEES